MFRYDQLTFYFKCWFSHETEKFQCVNGLFVQCLTEWCVENCIFCLYNEFFPTAFDGWYSTLSIFKIHFRARLVDSPNHIGWSYIIVLCILPNALPFHQYKKYIISNFRVNTLLGIYSYILTSLLVSTSMRELKLCNLYILFII